MMSHLYIAVNLDFTESGFITVIMHRFTYAGEKKRSFTDNGACLINLSKRCFLMKSLNKTDKKLVLQLSI